MAKLTVKEIVAAKPKDKPYKLTVERGLYLRIATNGEKPIYLKKIRKLIARKK